MVLELLGIYMGKKDCYLIQVNPKGNQYSLEGLMLKLKLQYFGYLMQRADLFGKD